VQSMSSNPYAPPATEVADVPQNSSARPPFFAVSLAKLIVMSVCTLSMYEIYWFYQNWKRINERESEKVLPAARAIFAVLFCYQCFSRIRDFQRPAGTSTDLRAGPLATGWILSTIAWKLPDPYWWISMSAILFMIPVQAHVIRINAEVAPGHDPNSRFTAWNWVAIVFGGLLVLLALVGTFLPDPGAA
jgi:Domain of unknown function (DUF4234)